MRFGSARISACPGAEEAEELERRTCGVCSYGRSLALVVFVASVRDYSAKLHVLSTRPCWLD